MLGAQHTPSSWLDHRRHVGEPFHGKNKRRFLVAVLVENQTQLGQILGDAGAPDARTEFLCFAE